MLSNNVQLEKPHLDKWSVPILLGLAPRYIGALLAMEGTLITASSFLFFFFHLPHDWLATPLACLRAKSRALYPCLPLSSIWRRASAATVL